MFKIGDFSRLTRVSVKMLRHYDELGLLKPTSVDTATGYRYYSADQLPRLNRIIALKDLGFSLDQIGKLIEENLHSDEIKGMLRLRLAEVEQQLSVEQARLAQVATRLHYIEHEGRSPTYDIVVRQIPSQMMAVIRQTVDNPGQPITMLFDEIEAYVARYGARAFSSPCTIYHDLEYREECLDVEVAVPIKGYIPDSERVEIREIPGATMACVVYMGSYERNVEVLHALLNWTQTHHYQIAGPIREVYLRFGADDAEALRLPEAFLTDNWQSYVTELQLPIEQP